MKKRGLLSKWLVVPLVAVLMISALTVGLTMAYFNDQETSTGNTSTAWTSPAWTQTLQTDFSAGTPSNVDTAISPDNVLLQAGTGAGANMILFWDGAAGSAPTDWTNVSVSGQPFYQKFPRGEATYTGTPGGAATHTHTAAFGTSTAATGGITASGTDVTGSNPTHTHTVASPTIPAASNLPSYRDLQVIRYSGIPTSIPAGAIAIFDTLPLPSGWTRHLAEDGLYVRGEAAATGTGVSPTHTHTVTLTTSGPSGTATGKGTAALTYATSTHTHTASSGNVTNTGNNAPPYITVVLAKANTATTIPFGMIAMFDASPTGDWSVVSSSVGPGPFYQRLLKGGSSYGATGGSETGHSHGNLTITLSAPSATLANGKNTGTNLATNAHTHTVGVTSFSPVSNMPPYVNVIFAKALYAASGTLASQVRDCGATNLGSGWDGLAWDATLNTGTITLAVRANDNSTTLAGMSWTTVGSSPVITGLPPGRFKQWRATLTAGSSQTVSPILAEVRLYYYGG